MRLTLLLFTLLFSGTFAFAQKDELVYRASEAGIEVKWYNQDLVSGKEFFVMRRENGGEWKQLNQTGIRLGAYKVSAADLQADKELKDYQKIADSPKKLEGFGLLLTTLKSFKSTPFSNYLGIYYRDEAVSPNTTYDYKLVERKGSELIELAVLNGINASSQSNMLPVDSLEFKLVKRGAAFRWKPESNRFYGVSIYRSLTPGSIGELITKDPVLLSTIKDEAGNAVLPESFYTDEKLSEKETYYYTFVGLNFFGESLAPSVQLKVRIKDETPPIPPADVTKQIFDKKVILNWNQPEASDDMAGYHIYASAPNDTILARVTSTPVPAGTTTYEFTAGRYALYTMCVASVDSEDNEGFSAEIFAETLDKIAPEAPVLVTIIPDTARLIVQWKPNSEADIMGYKIYRSVKGDVSAMALQTSTAFSQAEYTDSLPANAINSFSYAVIALDSSGNESVLSELATNVLIDITPPKSPFLKSVELVNEKEVMISWVRNTELDHKGYSVYRKNDSDSLAVFRQINIQPVPADVTQFTDRSVDRKNTYSYYVEAADERGNVSAPSNIVRFRMAPVKEENTLQITLSKAKYDKVTGSIRLRWKSKPYSETARYMVFRKNSSGAFVPVSALLELPRYTDTGFEKGSIAEYQVRIYDNGGQSQKSETLQVKIPTKNKTK